MFRPRHDAHQAERLTHRTVAEFRLCGSLDALETLVRRGSRTLYGSQFLREKEKNATRRLFGEEHVCVLSDWSVAFSILERIDFAAREDLRLALRPKASQGTDADR